MSEDFAGKKITVLGAARSGIAAARILKALGATVLLADSQPEEKFASGRLAEIQSVDVPVVFSANGEMALPMGTELVVTSPGVPKTAAILQAAVAREIPVWGEIELAFRLASAPMVATTGTNGKTTTTLLVGAMLKAAGFEAVVAGNISADEIKKTLVEAAVALTPGPSPKPSSLRSVGEGRQTPVGAFSSSPSIPAIPEGESRGTTEAVVSPLPSEERASLGEGPGVRAVLVAEISSFQLEWVERFAPRVAILTNITPDHLNRHASFAEYAQTKARIFAAQTPDDWAVVNYDDPAARVIGESGLPGQRVWFTRKSVPPEAGAAAWVQDGVMVVRLEASGEGVPILPVREVPFTLPGEHSIENVLAAAAASLAMGAEPEAIAEAVKTFPGVAHRMEFVAEVGGVRFVNNSMCTNVEAAVRSLQAMDRPTVVIAGGADKELDFAPLASTLKAKAKHLILIGSAADKMETTLRERGYLEISRAASLEEAVEMASSRTVPGEAVLLSPACASFDMFADFEARGAAFRAAVHALTPGITPPQPSPS